MLGEEKKRKIVGIITVKIKGLHIYTYYMLHATHEHSLPATKNNHVCLSASHGHGRCNSSSSSSFDFCIPPLLLPASLDASQKLHATEIRFFSFAVGIEFVCDAFLVDEACPVHARLVDDVEFLSFFCFLCGWWHGGCCCCSFCFRTVFCLGVCGCGCCAGPRELEFWG